MPVVFLEQDHPAILGNRYNRFTAAQGEELSLPPQAIVNSGHQRTNKLASTDFYTTYKNMVDTEMARLAAAEISARYTRVGSHISVQVKVKNLSGSTLSDGNGATVVVIVYEDAHLGLTNHIVYAVAEHSITTPLANNATGVYTLETADLSGVDWTKLHIVALADYRPSANSPAYDMLQAAFATPAEPLTVQPGILRFLVDSIDLIDQTQVITISGGELGLNWSITSASNWMTIEPTSGAVGMPAFARALASSLSEGMQMGVVLIHFTGPSGSFDRTLTVYAYKGQIRKLYLPVLTR